MSALYENSRSTGADVAARSAAAGDSATLIQYRVTTLQKNIPD